MPLGRPSARAFAALALLTTLATAPRAQFDAYSWDLTGCATVAGEELSLEICSASCSAVSSQATTVLPDTGSYGFDVDWTAYNTCCVELRVVLVSGGVASTLYQMGTPWGAAWCAPGSTPCSGSESVQFTAIAGDQLYFLLGGLSIGCDATGDVLRTEVELKQLTFTAGGVPSVTSIEATPAWFDTLLTIQGSGFDAGTTVEIDGVPEPIVSQSPTQISIQPGVHDPGFADLTVSNVFGSVTVEQGLAFRPTLAVSGGELGGNVEVTLANVLPGLFAWAVDEALLEPPLVLPQNEFYYQLLLNPATAVVPQGAAGFLLKNGTAQTVLPLPSNPAFEGREFFLQGLAQTGPTSFSFTNLAQVTLHLPLVPPSDLSYTTNPAVYEVGSPIPPNVPLFDGIATAWSVTPPFPSGLELDPDSGTVSGTPTTSAPAVNYVVEASNLTGSTTVALNITVTGPTDPHQGGAGSELHLVDLFWGRLVDVNDLDELTGESTLQVRDLVIGEDIQSDGTDFLLETNPITQAQRVVILHPVGSPGYAAAFAQLEAGLVPIQPKSLNPAELPPFSRVARNGALSLRFDDLLDETTLSLETLRVLTGYPPTTPFEARILPDPNHGGLASLDGAFHPTRVVLDFAVSALEAVGSSTPLPVNPVGLPAAVTAVAANVGIRIPTQVSPAMGQFEVLTNVAGTPVSTSGSGPVDLASPTLDVVRGMRSGGDVANLGDPFNGFLHDQDSPRILARQTLKVLSFFPSPSGAPDEFIVDLQYRVEPPLSPSPCWQDAQVGDVLEMPGGLLAEVTEDSPLITLGSVAILVSVPVRLLAGDPGAFTVGQGFLHSPFDPATDPLPCMLDLSPTPGLPPTSSVQPDSTVAVRFSEPVDSVSVQPFDTFTITSSPPPTGPSGFIVGSVVSSIDLQEVHFVPTLPLPHTQGQAEVYYVSVEAAPDGLRDLAGNTLAAGLPGIELAVDPVAPSASSGGIVLRFESLDEDQNGAPEIAGQFLFDADQEAILPRPVSRFAGLADRSQVVPGLMTPFGQGVQTPLVPLGSRLMTTYRHFDFGFPSEDEALYNIDVEGLSWSPVAGQVIFDTFPEFEIALSHGNFLPDEALNPASLLQQFPASGLSTTSFADNVLADPENPSTVVHEREKGYTISPLDLYTTVSGTKMVPYPLNQDVDPTDDSYYTWRDTSVRATGAPGGAGTDPQILVDAGLAVSAGQIAAPGFVPSIGLPLLLDLKCFPSDSSIGLNTLDVSLASIVQPLPRFRVYSSGGFDTSGLPVIKNPDLELVPDGGFDVTSTPPGLPTLPGDSVFYVGEVDFVVRKSRVHTIFFDTGLLDPDYVSVELEPGAGELPAGTEILIEFRGADQVTDQPDGSPHVDASVLDAYGDLGDNDHSGVPGDPAAKNSGIVFHTDDGWKASIDEIDGARFVQVRITLTSNPTTLLTPVLSSLAISFADTL